MLFFNLNWGEEGSPCRGYKRCCCSQGLGQAGDRGPARRWPQHLSLHSLAAPRLSFPAAKRGSCIGCSAPRPAVTPPGGGTVRRWMGTALRSPESGEGRRQLLGGLQLPLPVVLWLLRMREPEQAASSTRTRGWDEH